jgi:septation ring formation regulator EzrA
MQLDDLNQLEEKVRSLVNHLKIVKDENIRLQSEIDSLKKVSTVNDEERQQVKKKVETLIELIDSIEK